MRARETAKGSFGAREEIVVVVTPVEEWKWLSAVEEMEGSEGMEEASRERRKKNMKVYRARDAS